MPDQVNTQNPASQVVAGANDAENISGRGVFIIETVPIGVSVRTAFLAEDGRLIDVPAVFPDLMYAMSQIDELRQHVARRFAEAAQVGSQVIAQQIKSNRAQSQPSAASAAEQTAEQKTSQHRRLSKGSTRSSAKVSKKSVKQKLDQNLG